MIRDGYSIAVPAYGRPNELEELLFSIYNMDKMPSEIIICEDYSKERNILNELCKTWEKRFSSKGTQFNYIENEVNLGYDANIRKLIKEASFKWVILMGNDDLFLKNGLTIIDNFCQRNSDLGMISRPFIRFNTDINKPLGISRLFNEEQVFSYKSNFSSKYIFRACGFVGGLIVNKNWASSYHTDKYDGSLYYQIYLGCVAYCTQSIGYLKGPSVGGRAGNPPMFGEAGAKNHVPGAYSASGRASMWKGVLDMASDVGKIYNTDLLTDIKHELTVRQSFHVFEMNAGVDKSTLRELKVKLSEIGLFNHIVPKSFYYINYILGSKSRIIYSIIRKYIQNG